MNKIRLFHFDIKTLGNYGDTILFEAVRHVFQGYGSRKVFKFGGTANLRNVVTPKVVGSLNDNYDAVLIGGGGLFLSDTNPNDRSGWQWNISIEQLKRIEKPLIIFAVGNNRFIGQADFSSRFIEHLNIVVEKSIFFGLRNYGSVETIKEYLSPELRHKVVYQPCPTTIMAHLCPDLYVKHLERPNKVAFQALIGKRQTAANFNKHEIYNELGKAIKILQGKKFHTEIFANARGDKEFHADILDQKIKIDRHDIFYLRDIFEPLRYIASTAISVGMRGHAQMIPFGLGNPIVSLFTHNKLKYFLDDIGFPELLVDVRQKNFADKLVEKVEMLHNNIGSIRASFFQKQLDLFRVTMGNLADIERKLTGFTTAPHFIPLTPFEREISNTAYLATLDKENLNAGLSKDGDTRPMPQIDPVV